MEWKRTVYGHWWNVTGSQPLESHPGVVNDTWRDAGQDAAMIEQGSVKGVSPPLRSGY